MDAAIQHALAGLYPPFEATAPTILGQVFRLLDSDFRGDGLNFLLDFLIPAKRLCEQVREAACVSQKGCGTGGQALPEGQGLEVSREGGGLVSVLLKSMNWGRGMAFRYHCLLQKRLQPHKWTGRSLGPLPSDI